MKKSIKSIVYENDDLHFININKPDKNNKKTWSFTINDETSELSGLSDMLSNYNHQIVTLRRGSHYFLAYKIYFNNKYEYFIDTRKANHRDSTSTFIKGLIDYMVYSNDISTLKNVSSFKFTKREMKQQNIDNYLDLCAYFGEYSAIGSGYTRDLRNLVVMDIDVDCTKDVNINALNDLLIKFAKCRSLPDFYIFNHESNHVQLQWVVKNVYYKDINEEVKNETIDNLNKDKNKSKEINLNNIDFTKLTDEGIAYRIFTRSLTDIVPKHKFGDKNYTFWKAKNFYTAFLGLYNLELKVPLYDGNEIYYMERDEIEYNFGTKEGRKRYYDEAYTLGELTFNTRHLVSESIKKIKVKKIEKIKDEDNSNTDDSKNQKKIYGKSRNNFVLICTRETTWELARENGYKNYKDISDLSNIDFNLFRTNVFKTVKNRFKEEDKKYKGHWPETTNISKYNNSEFESTFNGSFNYAIQHLNYTGYTNEQRTKSLENRQIGKDIHLSLVDFIRNNNKKIKRDELLYEVNSVLKSSGKKEISLASLNRYIKTSKSMTLDERKKLYSDIMYIYTERQAQLKKAIEDKNEKKINSCKKRLNYINLNIIKDLCIK